jgi:hypothetical protein
MSFSPQKEQSLKFLIDDPDPAVQAGLLREFLENQEDAFIFLEKLSDDSDNSLSHNADFYLRQLFFADPTFAFLYWTHHQALDLLQASAVIEHIIRPEVNQDMLQRAIDAFVERTRDLAPSPTNPKEKIRILNRILFHEGGFRAESDKVFAPNFFTALLYHSTASRPQLHSCYLLQNHRRTFRSRLRFHSLSGQSRLFGIPDHE